MTGTEAITRMRNLRKLPNAHFGIVFIKESDCTIRVIEQCRLRSARKDEGLKIASDHYLYFTDMETGTPKTCFKKLIRKVAFPPNYIWQKVKWFE